MKKTISAHRLYFIIYLLFIITSVIALIQYSKVDIHLFFNSISSNFSDVFFKYITHVGDGFALVLITLVLLFFSKRFALQVGLSGIVSGLIAQLLKKVVFGPTPRPSKFFEDLGIPLRFVEGVELHAVFSFPSGHTTAVFALTTSLLFVFSSRKYDVWLITLGILTAYSRIYLSQHFLSDIVLGSFIGICTALVIQSFLFSNKLIANNELDKPLIKLSKN